MIAGPQIGLEVQLEATRLAIGSAQHKEILAGKVAILAVNEAVLAIAVALVIVVV